MENEKLKELYTNRIKEDLDGYERALNTFEKHLDRIPKTNDAILQKAAYDSFSDVGEIRVYFASKILTPCRMH